MRKRLKRHLPDREKIKSIKALKIFGELIHNPNLWHLNRYSIATALSVGLFFAWIPVPFQMVLAAGGALIFHANLPLSVALVWLTNPLTMPPLFYFAYRIGALMMGLPPRPFEFKLSWEWLSSLVGTIWQPLLLGSMVCAVGSALFGNLIFRGLWRIHIVRSINKRRQRRLDRARSRAGRAKNDE